MLPTSALNVWSSTPRQTRRTCWIWTWLHATERRGELTRWVRRFHFASTGMLRYLCCS